MSAQAYIRGHAVILAGDRRYADDLTPVTSERPCVRCGRLPVAGVGADACLGVLPGVRGACCGHGVSQAYVLFDDGTRLHPSDVETFFAIMARRES
jgi:hypothetical protein